MKSSERHQARLFGRVATHVDKVNKSPPYAQWPDLMVLARQRQRNCFWLMSEEQIAYIYDNSIENHLPQLLYRTTDGNLAKQYVADIPEWAQILI